MRSYALRTYVAKQGCKNNEENFQVKIWGNEHKLIQFKFTSASWSASVLEYVVNVVWPPLFHTKKCTSTSPNAICYSTCATLLAQHPTNERVWHPQFSMPFPFPFLWYCPSVRNYAVDFLNTFFHPTITFLFTSLLVSVIFYM